MSLSWVSALSRVSERRGKGGCEVPGDEQREGLKRCRRVSPAMDSAMD